MPEGKRRGGRDTIGWKLDPEQRVELLRQFPPAYANVVADHVTLKSKPAGAGPLPEPQTGHIVGKVDDGRGVEAMVVEIGGTTDRPDGSTYHITWSLGPGRKAVESNDALREHQWVSFDLPMPIDLHPARFP
jgi:hypothetical protein